MKKKQSLTLGILVIVLLVAVVGWRLHVLRIVTPDGTVTADSFIRNLTWSTPLSKSVPSKQGDTVEYISILKPSRPEAVSVSISALAARIDITSLSLNDRPITASDLKNLTITGTSVLHVEGKARDTSVMPGTADSLAQVRTLRSVPTPAQT